MLYPKEDKLNNTLMFACRMCPYAEQSDAACTYRNALKEEIAETAGNVEDVAQDPTVGDSFQYAADDEEDYYGASAMDVDMDLEGEEEEVVPEMCTLCGKEIKCPFCGQPTSNGLRLETNDPSAFLANGNEEERVKAEQRERSQSSAASLKR